MRLRITYHVISTPVVLTGTGRIVCTRSGQMASNLSQIRVLLYSTLTISSFPLRIEKNIEAMKISRFLVQSALLGWFGGLASLSTMAIKQ